MFYNQIINDLGLLGKFLGDWLKRPSISPALEQAVIDSYIHNPLFTPIMQFAAIDSIVSNYLAEDKLNKWISTYDLCRDDLKFKRIGVLAAGNIPLVVFHDYLIAIISGVQANIKLSSKDMFLLPIIHKEFLRLSSNFGYKISFCNQLDESDYDAIIATGGDNAVSHFKKVYNNIPVLARGDKFSYTVLKGDETATDLLNLAMDIILYYGLGCRSISYLLLPYGYDFSLLKMAFKEAVQCILNKYKPVYDGFEGFSREVLIPFLGSYKKNKAMMVMLGEPFEDFGYMLFVEDDSFGKKAVPFSSVHFSYYSKLSENDILKEFALKNNSKIQKIYTIFGMSQQPQLDDYADGVDTIKFLMNLIN